ncbi:MAG: diguanylate cyclase/phosphodiesterase (GGDEF & EAL domains) with PAS/PAC sensor(s) [uncultured Sphingomonas sp.]|uniref:Diguanylate cyclase/phosphodiesterase (GGDEF & EAL domains) with PAS/PAC sensor(S) n=2 Tax=uncultured Sphingomonas sp. TaxID=158754 RepID=A0A6J4TRV5_9SPHN|nr:MAG: diguanylate cyclase/phosphodiesterase (GGDEF & EAL domains) with PAS/PAC sensor(s) [uncultured Sphingomonas sp.]
MVARTRSGNQTGNSIEALPLPLFTRHAAIASVSFFYNYQDAVWRLPYSAQASRRAIPSLSVAIAGLPGRSPGGYRLDYSILPATVPYVSASEVLTGRVDSRAFKNKQVVIGAAADQKNSGYWIPGQGRMPSAMVHIIGAETLKKGSPRDLGFIPAWLLAMVVVALTIFRTKGLRTAALLAGTASLLLFGPVVFEAYLMFVDVMAAFFALAFVAARLGWLRWQSGGYINSLSGLPNLAALRAEQGGSSQAMVAARIHNYAEIASTLDPNEEATLIGQMVQRLLVAGGSDARIFHGDEGVFAWFVSLEAPLANHLEALHALFRSPLSVNGQTIDAAVTFGAELGSARPLQNRLGSALVAANEAWDEGLKWKYHDPSKQEDVGWRISLLGQLDAAIDNGEVWVAYQPQLDLSRQQIVGAEALARWTHPVKGPISPTEFVAAAEQQGRIGKLTDFILDRAIATAAAVNRRGVHFSVAVNISARLLADKGLVTRVQQLLRTHGLAADRLTLELTETEALHSSATGPAVLEALRDYGVRIAIDDYGTGLSTLEYLKKVPANEIKIDQTFVKAMRHSRSDFIMVESTIALAHSLGRTVVAEGVEDRTLLDQLAQLGCDVAQGYAIGRPMGVRELIQHLQLRTSRRVA